MSIEKFFGDYVFPGWPVAKIIIQINLFLDMFPIDELNLIDTVTNVDLHKKIFPATTRWEIIKFFGVIILITH